MLWGRRRKPEANQVYLVFLSHSPGDGLVADLIAEKIRRKGGEVWLDIHKLAGGDRIYDRILSAVDSCDEAIVLLTPYSIHSKWVLFEMGALCSQHKRITPVLDHVKPEEVPIISGVRAIDINEIDRLLLPELTQRISERAGARGNGKGSGR